MRLSCVNLFKAACSAASVLVRARGALGRSCPCIDLFCADHWELLHTSCIVVKGGPYRIENYVKLAGCSNIALRSVPIVNGRARCRVRLHVAVSIYNADCVEQLALASRLLQLRANVQCQKLRVQSVQQTMSVRKAYTTKALSATWNISLWRFTFIEAIVSRIAGARAGRCRSCDSVRLLSNHQHACPVES
eukprot:6196805-Pleurochrysis_carterae.AAC.2